MPTVVRTTLFASSSFSVQWRPSSVSSSRPYGIGDPVDYHGMILHLREREKISQRDVIARGVFTSTADLARKLRRYINAYSKNAKPFRWKYSTPSRHIRYAKTSSATVN